MVKNIYQYCERPELRDLATLGPLHGEYGLGGKCCIKCWRARISIRYNKIWMSWMWVMMCCHGAWWTCFHESSSLVCESKGEGRVLSCVWSWWDHVEHECNVDNILFEKYDIVVMVIFGDKLWRGCVRCSIYVLCCVCKGRSNDGLTTWDSRGDVDLCVMCWWTYVFSLPSFDTIDKGAFTNL